MNHREYCPHEPLTVDDTYPYHEDAESPQTMDPEALAEAVTLPPWPGFMKYYLQARFGNEALAGMSPAAIEELYRLGTSGATDAELVQEPVAVDLEKWDGPQFDPLLDAYEGPRGDFLPAA